MELIILKESLGILKTNLKIKKNRDLIAVGPIVFVTHVLLCSLRFRWGWKICSSVPWDIVSDKFTILAFDDLTILIEHRHLELIVIMTLPWLCFILKIYPQKKQGNCGFTKIRKKIAIISKNYVTVISERNNSSR